MSEIKTSDALLRQILDSSPSSESLDDEKDPDLQLFTLFEGPLSTLSREFNSMNELRAALEICKKDHVLDYIVNWFHTWTLEKHFYPVLSLHWIWIGRGGI